MSALVQLGEIRHYKGTLPYALSPKYDISKFTETYRKAERQRTVLLPVLMGFIIVASFLLVSQTRPKKPDTSDVPDYLKPSQSADRSGNSEDNSTLNSPPKIDLDLDLDPEISRVPVIDPGIKMPEKASIPKARVIEADPVSVDGLPLIQPENTEDRFTPWMTPTELNEHILALNQGFEVSFWDRGHWISAVEGRWNSGRQEYRIVYEKAPKGVDFSWRYRIAQNRDTFSRNIRQLRSEGYTLVQSQAYGMPDQSLRYQSVWRKIE